MGVAVLPLADKAEQGSPSKQMPFFQNWLPKVTCRVPCRAVTASLLAHPLGNRLECFLFSRGPAVEGRGGLNITPGGLVALLPALTSGQVVGRAWARTVLQLLAHTGPLGTWGITGHWQPGPGCTFGLSLL